MIDYTYILLLLVYAILALGFAFKEKFFLMFAAIALIAVGVYIELNGLGNTFNWLVESFGIIHIGLGAYIFIRSSLEDNEEQGGTYYETED